MANEIIAADTSSPEYTSALALHQQITVNGQLVAEHFVEMCRCIKQMRDQVLYKPLGYDDFGAYCEDMLHIKARQGYNYIKVYEELPPAFLQSNAKLGVTKLELLTHVNPLDREDFMDQVKAEDMTVSELKAEIERLKLENCEKGEQISMFEEQNRELTNKNLDIVKSNADITACNEDLKKQIKELSDKPAEVAVREPDPEEIDKLVQKALAEDKAKHKAEISKLKDKLDKSEREKAALQEQVDGAESASQEKVKALEDKLAKAENNADAEQITMKFYLGELQKDLQQISSELKKIADEEKRKKIKGAVVHFLNLVLEEISENDT